MEPIKKGLRSPMKALRYVLRDGVVALSSRRPLGTHVLSKDWDLLIILDTCRVDALRAVASEYEFIGDVDRIRSIGGSSPEWIAHTFSREWDETLANTAYLNVNAWAERVLKGRLQADNPHIDHTGLKRLHRFGTWDIIRPEELGSLEHVWKYVQEGEGDWATTIPEEHLHGRAPARTLTDRAISVGRDHDFNRLILHYTQPHHPYISTAMKEGRMLHDYEENPFAYIQRTGDRQTAFDAYLDELRYVLDDVEVLLENLDAENVVISSDHGEAFGEYGTYIHHAGSLHPKIRYVPWAETTAADTGAYTPETNPVESSEQSVDEALEALGYKI
jgi:hypothetical protein